MARGGEDIVARARLDDAAEIHHRHAVAHVATTDRSCEMKM